MVSPTLRFDLLLQGKYSSKSQFTCVWPLKFTLTLSIGSFLRRQSTDGHCGYWSFNLRRFNPHVALRAATSGIIALTDSTRKGKRFPDAFSRTIPIWASVVNRAVYRYRAIKSGLEKPKLEDIPSEWKTLIMPEWIPESEKRQVSPKLEEFCDLLLSSDAMRPTLEDLALQVLKPLQCFWISPSSHPTRLENEHLIADTIHLPCEERHWIILLCPSDEQELVQDTHIWYIQGAADDEETWAQGLTANLFWKHKDFLMAQEDEIGENIQRVVAGKGLESHEAVLSHNGSTKRGANSPSELTLEQQQVLINSEVTWIVPGVLAISDRPASCSPSALAVFDLVINCSSMEYEALAEAANSEASKLAGKKYMRLVDPFEKGNNVKYKLSRRLPATLEFMRRYFRVSSPDSAPSSSDASSPTTVEVFGRPLLLHGVEAFEIVIGLCIGVLAANWDDSVSMILPVAKPRKSLTKLLLKQYLLFVAKLEPTQLPSVMVADLNRYFLTTPDAPVVEQEKKLITYVP